MGNSGIEVEETLKAEFDLLQAQRLVPAIQLLVMEMSDDDTKVVKVPEHCMEKCSIDDLKKFFTRDDVANRCYYVVFDKGYLVLIKWTPDSAKVKQKMLYSSTFNNLKASFGSGIKLAVEACDLDDVVSKI